MCWDWQLPSGRYQPYLEHPTSQTAGRPAGADACVAGPGDRRQASTDAILLSPPAPWHRPPGTPVFEPAACSSSGRYSPLVVVVPTEIAAAEVVFSTEVTSTAAPVVEVVATVALA